MSAFGHLPDPKAIYQEHLDVLSGALLSGSFTAFAARISLPLRIITETTERTIETREDLAQAFFSMNKTLKAQQVTEHLRLVTRAEYKSETRICGLHETHIISRGKRLVPPYPNRVRLELINGNWLETSSANAIAQDTRTMPMPKVSAQPRLPEFPDYDPERTPQ